MDNNINSSPQLSLQDLKNMLVIIDLACNRGAIRAGELTAVGALYDKINTFVQNNPQGDVNV